MLNKKFIITIGLIVFFMLLDFFGAMDPARYLFLKTSSATATPAIGALSEIRGFFHTLFAMSDLIKENGRLNSENLELTQKLVTLESLIQENSALRKNLEIKMKQNVFIACNIIGRDILGVSDAYVSDCGQSDGVKEGSLVISSGFVFGNIAVAQLNTSTIRPIFSGNFSIDGVIAGTNEPVVVKGKLGRDVVVEVVSEKFNIRGGELIVTSAISGKNLGGYLIGVVGESLSEGSLTRQYRLIQQNSLASLESVLIQR